MATHTREIAGPIPDTPEIDSIILQLPVGVVIAEAPGGRCVAANARAMQIFVGRLERLESIEAYGRLYKAYGSSGREYRPEEWPLARAIRYGEVVQNEEIELVLPPGDRRILIVSATPIVDADGRIIRGVTVFHDITEQRMEERCRQFLMDLSDELRIIDEPVQIMSMAASSIGEHLGSSSAAFADIDPGSRYAIIQAEYRQGRIVSTGKYLLEDFGLKLVERLRHGESVAIADTTASNDITTDIFNRWGIRSVIAVPVIRQNRFAALLAVLHNTPRAWTRADIALVGNVMERTWHAVENARVHAGLRQSREWLTLALRAGSAATWEWDLRSGEIHWSEEQSGLLGLDLPRRSLTFGRWLALVHPDDRAGAKEAARHIATMREGEIEFEYRVAGTGQPRWITMRGRVLADPRGLPFRVVGVAVDTTDRKMTELEREALLREARDASESKSHFISVISHEFRTPLTAIIGYTDLLSAGVSGPLVPTQQRQLDRIRTSAWHLTQMVDEILTFSRLEAGRESVNFETADVVALARDTAALVAPGAAAKGLSLACELPGEALPVRTDSGKLRQVLLNLLGNAVKFTEKGCVLLRVEAVQNAVEIVVNDTGIGIEADDLEHIFERFWQAGQGTSRPVSGAGLGLTVSRRLVELLGGQLTVDSEVGAGSTFRFRIPFPRR